MALFRLFSTKQVANSDVVPMATDSQDVENENNVPLDKEKEDEGKQKIITIKWGTGMPIDVIFNFIHKNFEEEGFQDALVNSDISYRDAKEKIIRNDLEMLFKRIILCYKKNIREVDVKIVNARQALALGSVSNLEALRETYEEHLQEISEMQEQLDANDPKMTTMIESYRRGFLKGITALTQNFINNNEK